MQRKTIEKILAHKFEEWVATITCDKTKELVTKNSLITGGCIVSMLLDEKVKDFDVYFTNHETALAVALYYVDVFKKNTGQGAIEVDTQELMNQRVRIKVQSRGVALEKDALLDEPHEDMAEELPEEENKKEYRPICLSSNAITLSNKIQCIIRFYGPADKIHESYDYVHCTNYWLSSDQKLVLNPKALESIITKTLYYQGSQYPVCSVIRMRKYVKRGWKINAGQILKMLFQVSELDLQNIDVLEDQLTGVDSAYFHILIEALRQQKESKGDDFKYGAAYIATLIDKIFG